MHNVKISQLIVSAAVTAAGLVGFGGIAAAAPTATTAAVACINGDGVMDLVVTNPATDATAEFVVTNPETFVASVIDVGPGSSQVVTVNGLADGSVVVPVQFNGNDASVSTQIACDTPVCTEGVVTTVIDDNGVQHQACVASAAGGPAPVPAPVDPPAKATLRSSTPTTSPQQLPSTGAGTTSGLVIAALLVGSGSVASLLSRRKP